MKTLRQIIFTAFAVASLAVAASAQKNDPQKPPPKEPPPKIVPGDGKKQPTPTPKGPKKPGMSFYFRNPEVEEA